MIVDCFPFFNETDLLEIRLNALAPYVGRFVLCEMPITHSGKPKPLYFDANKERFKNFPITHISVEDNPKYVLKPGRYGKRINDSHTAWRREHYQRECLMQGLEDLAPDDMILISDMDEIPNLENFNVSGAIAVGTPVPLDYLLWAASYGAVYATIALLGAMVLFQGREIR